MSNSRKGPVKAIKGRGTAENPPNRFDRISVELDPLEEGDETPRIATEFFDDRARSVLSFNDSPDVGFEVSLNPYRGCEHGCAYCYARPSHEYFGLSAGLDFETRIFVKRDAADLLRRSLRSRSWTPRAIALSGVTDPYQPAERRLGITRKCLEVLAEFRNPVSVITKNRLITRDLDLLGQLARHNLVVANISITTLRPDIHRKLEPRTASPTQRLAAIRDLAAAGVPVRVMVAPVIPGLTDHELPGILKEAANAGAIGAGYLILRLPSAVLQLFDDWLRLHFPERREKVLSAIREVRSGRLNDSRFFLRHQGEGPYAETIASLFQVTTRRLGLNQRSMILSCEAFRQPWSSRQLNLFD